MHNGVGVLICSPTIYNQEIVVSHWFKAFIKAKLLVNKYKYQEGY